MDDGQHGCWTIFSRSEAVDDGWVEFMHGRKVEVEATAMLEPFGAQGALVEATH